jgi:hypothetical protein
MIKIIVLSVAILTFPFLKAQNEADVIRYSFQTLGSTARSYGVAGAFGSIGADPSCAGINPAGLARYRNSSVNLSTGFYNAKNKANYIFTEISDNKFNFNLPNLGLIVNIPAEDYENKKPEGFVNFVFAFNVNRLNNFHKRSIFDAPNSKSSITQNWAERASATNTIPDNFSKYSLEHLAYSAWVIDEDTSSPTPRYISAYGKTPLINVNQQGTIITRGALNDYNVSFAGNYKHILLVGISLGAKSIRYIESNSFTEKDLKPLSQGKDIDELTFDQYLKTSGLGLNAKIGVNVAPNEYLRMGYAYHSPTTFNLTDSYSYTISSKFDFGSVDPFGRLRENSVESTDATVYKYKLSIPGRHVFSAGLVSKKMGFISLDLESVNFTQGNLSAKDYPFTKENLSIKKTLNPSVLNVRLGGELVQDQYRIRAGYARYPSVYKEGSVPFVSNLVNNVYSFGFGIRTVDYSFDFAYVNSGYSDYSVPYTIDPAVTGNQYTAYSITNNVRTTSIILSASFVID